MAPKISPTKSDKASDSPATDESGYIRLHITPLDQELVKIILPAAVLPSARNISFHTLETFPDKRYGFVDLPLMEAEKLKKKLNGATLKGSKLRIEKARPEERLEPCNDSEPELKSQKRKSKDEHDSTKKRKRDHNVVEGVVITDRKVKRGWTESADTKRKNKKTKDKSTKDKAHDKRKQQKSKYTEQDECLLKTKLPPNVVSNLPAGDAHKKKKKKNGNTREITVHEFEKTTKFPSFLKNTAPETNGKPATEFLEGQGWVDEDGNVVEAVKQKEIPVAKPKRTESAKITVVAPKESDDDDDDDDDDDSDTSSSGTSSEEDDSDSDESEKADVQDDKSAAEVDSDSSSSEDDASSDDSSHLEQGASTSASTRKPDDARPVSSSSSRSLTIKIPPPPAATPSSTKVHPLEALYKRAKPSEPSTTQTPTQQQSEPFSFFGGAAADGENSDDMQGDQEPPALAIPMTPYTRQDLEWRNVRSAAPTPDTAHPSRMKNFWASQQGNDDDEMHDVEEEEEEDDDAAEGEGVPPAQGTGTSDFQSWFWENRRDLNKSWMTRRKGAAKEKRHRENKARASKAI